MVAVPTKNNGRKLHSDDKADAAVVDRRDMLRGAAAIAATALVATDASARDFGRNAEPQRYPDPDIVVIDAMFKAKVGNTAIKRARIPAVCGRSGPAWNAQGQYLVWSDIPNNRQLRLSRR